MAHPIVEKLKTFGIRHGEKVAVAVVSALSLMMVAMAFSRPSIDITGEQITKATQQAQQNINAEQKEDSIVKAIRDQGIVLPNFEKVVDERQPGSADPARYELTNVLAAPEPGAGLLRDQPELIRVAKLEVHPGRGSIRLLEVDEQGDVIYEEPKKETTKPKSKRSRRGGRGMAGMAGGGGAMGGYGRMMEGGQGKESDREKADREKRERAEQTRLSKSIAGSAAAAFEKKAEETTTPADGREEKTSLNGFRWVAITGVVDHKRLRENYARALKLDFAAANPHYLRVDLERQQRGENGAWSDWKPVDRAYIEENITRLLTETEPTEGPTGKPIVKEEVSLKELVDQLPFLEVGYWVGVFHGDLVNQETLEKPKAQTGMAGMAGMMTGRGGMMGMMPGRGPGTAGMSGGRGGMMGSGRGGMMGEGAMGAYGKMFGGGGLGETDTNFTKSDSDKVMVRALDFTVEEDTGYRYRVRLVVKNPNLKRESVSPGVDRDSEELNGPWSEITAAVAVPPDVETYVKGTPPADLRQKRRDLIEFNVVRWNPANGLTLVEQFYQAPGDIIGAPDNVSVPVEVGDETRVQSKSIDFTSRRLLVDTASGTTPGDRLGLTLGGYSNPTVAVLLRPDGLIELRDEATDLVSGQMTEMMSIYRQTLEDANKEEKESSTLMNPYGSMGGSGGMLGASGT